MKSARAGRGDGGVTGTGESGQEKQPSDTEATANVLFISLNRNKVLVCPMKSAPVMLTLSDSKHVVLPVDDDSDLNVVASFDRRGEYIYTGNAKGKVSLEVGEISISHPVCWLSSCFLGLLPLIFLLSLD